MHVVNKNQKRGSKIAVIKVFDHLCGYVLIKPDSPIFHMHYDEVMNLFPELNYIHGGLTFDGDRDCAGLDGHWIGFDCGHYLDYSDPKDVDFCLKECKKIVDIISNKSAIADIKRGSYELS